MSESLVNTFGPGREPVAARHHPTGHDGDGASLLVAAGVILRRYRWLIATCAGGCALTALALISRIEPVYEATASLRVDSRLSQMPALDVMRLAATNNLSTEMEMLRARALATVVADSLDLRVRLVQPAGVPRSSVLDSIVVTPDAGRGRYIAERRAGGVFAIRDAPGGPVLVSAAPGERVTVNGTTFRLARGASERERFELELLSADEAAARIVGSIRVLKRNRDADLLEVRVRDSDPEVARDVANTVVANFIVERRLSRQAESRSTAIFVREQLERVSTQLTRSERALRSYRESANIVSVQDQATAEVRRAADLLAQRNALSVERVALERLLRDGRSAARATGDSLASYRDLVAFPSLIRNQAVTTLLNSLAHAEDRRVELLARRRPDDPDVQILTARTEELEQQLGKMAVGYLQGLRNQVDALDDVLSSSRREMSSIPAKEMRYAQLQRDVRGLEQLYDQLQTRLKEAEVAEAAEDGSVRLVDAALTPRSPVNRRATLLLVLATLAGMTIGILAGVVRELADASVRTRGDAEVALGVPVLGLVPRMGRPRTLPGRAMAMLPSVSSRRRRRQRLAPHADVRMDAGDRASAANAFERLHTNILFASAPASPRVVVFASALPGEGKTTTAVNLAILLAQRGSRVVLLDGDLRRGRVNAVLRAPRGPGLAELLAGKVMLDEVRRTVSVSDGSTLDFLTTGRFPSNPAQLLGSAEMDRLLEELRASYDLVIIDSSPLNIVADASLVGAKADGVIMVARAGSTPVGALVYAGEQARSARLPVIGALLNDIDFARDAAYDDAYLSHAYGAYGYVSMPAGR